MSNKANADKINLTKTKSNTPENPEQLVIADDRLSAAHKSVDESNASPVLSKGAKHDDNSSNQQQQARRLLLIAQWLLLLVMLVVVIWLCLHEWNTDDGLLERVKSNEQMMARLNDMDDRLYAISQQTTPTPNKLDAEDVSNQLNILKIQSKSAENLLKFADYDAVIELLQAMQWQLSQENTRIAATLKLALKQSIAADVKTLEQQKTQPNQWQLHAVAINEAKTFLFSRVTLRQNPYDQQALTQYDALIYQAIMTLNLASQAADLQNTDMMLMHLEQAKNQLTPLQSHLSKTPEKASKTTNTKTNTTTNKATGQVTEQATSKSTPKIMENTAIVELNATQLSTDKPDSMMLPEHAQRQGLKLASIAGVVVLIDDLINRPPTPIKLQTVQMLATQNELLAPDKK